MLIDETKGYAICRIDQQHQDLKKKCSDHNVIPLKIDFHTESIYSNERKIITTKGYKEYRENKEQLEISKLITTRQIQKSYGSGVK